MQALVYGGPGKRSWAEKAKPKLLAPTDAIVRVVRTTICGTDLHILRGDVPSVAEGRTLGHEGVGVIEEIGDAVTGFRVGDHVIISCITACGRCDFCRRAMYSRCRHGGWLLGHTIDGTQAERVRIPFADTSLHPVPKGAAEDTLVMLSDILPTGFECGVLNGGVKPGDTVAIVGAGPIGLATLMTALMLSPAAVIVVDTDLHRLALAKSLGAAHVVDAGNGGAVEAVLALTSGEGVDVAIEAVGTPETFDVCQRILGAGSHLANVGVHGKSVCLALERLWDRNVTITTGLVDTRTTPLLLRTITSGKLDPSRLVSHRLGLAELMRAYDLFGAAAEEKVLKIVLAAD